MKRQFIALTAFVTLLFAAISPSVSRAERGEAHFSAPTVTAAPGSTVDIPVSISGNYQAHGLTLWLVFDDASFSLEGIIRGELLSAVSGSGGMVILEPKVSGAENSVRLGVIMPTEPFSAQGVLFTARLRIKPGIAAGTTLSIPIRVPEFVYMPIGAAQEPISYSVARGKVNVSGTPAPTSASTPTPLPTQNASPAPSTPTAQPTGTAHTSNSPKPNVTPTGGPIAPISKVPISEAPYTPADQTPLPDLLSADPYERFSDDPISYASPDVSESPEGDPFATFSPMPPDTLPPEAPVASRSTNVALIAGIFAAVLAAAFGVMLLISKRKAGSDQ